MGPGGHRDRCRDGSDTGLVEQGRGWCCSHESVHLGSVLGEIVVARFERLPRFEDRGLDGVPRVVSFHAKRARGTMAAWLVRNRVRSVAKIHSFDGDGYALDEARSTRWNPIFVR